MAGVGVSVHRGRKINPLETATLLVRSLSKVQVEGASPPGRIPEGVRPGPGWEGHDQDSVSLPL